MQQKLLSLAISLIEVAVVALVSTYAEKTIKMITDKKV